ncbi:hypothetical protein [Pontibacter mangrovi]|uniref:Phage portal protein n=1 Tax=Pontibacter mangrovi TaxID=2589816 RepID=A0A501WDG8_9BACT|nr:hypothetical protein [Pontibacter mangrovi]TPE44927.1 hypothetical protein FJM65_07895 [Pontibacter mangrovi]
MHAEYISVALSVPEPPEVKVNKQKGWVEYGKKHSYWASLIKLKKNSPTQRSVTATKTALLRGEGFSYDEKNAPLHEFMCNMAGEGRHANRQLAGIAADKAFLNGWAVQVLWNDAGDSVAEIHHQRISTVAPEPMNDEGVIEGYYLCRDWSKSQDAKFKPEWIAAFNPDTAKNQKRQLYVSMTPSDSNDYFPEPECDAALAYMQLENDLGEYHLGNVQGNFAPRNLLYVPNDPPPREGQSIAEARKEFVDAIKKKTTGPKGESLLVIFGEAGVDAASIVPYSPPVNADIYNTYSSLAVEKILAANRVPSPTIVGLPGGASLGGDSGTIRTAYELYYNTVVRPEQVDIIEGFEELLQYVQGVELKGDADTPALDIVTNLPVKFTFSEGLLQDIADVDELRAMVDMKPLEENTFDSETRDKLVELLEKMQGGELSRASVYGLLTVLYKLSPKEANALLGPETATGANAEQGA